tara:strand:+ start:5855 stop:6040 length:186 start_codon:yes stop_codon:yes gene_type:complete
MKANIYKILDAAISEGIDSGYTRAFKHTDDPSTLNIKQALDRAIWENINEVFTFEQEYTEE